MIRNLCRYSNRIYPIRPVRIPVSMYATRLYTKPKEKKTEKKDHTRPAPLLDKQILHSYKRETEPPTSEKEAKKEPKKATKPVKNRFEKSADYELFRSLISSKELEESEKIIMNASKENTLIVAKETYNLQLAAWVKDGKLNRALHFWSFYRAHGIRLTPRSYSIIFNGLLHQRRSPLLPGFMEQLSKSKIRPERFIADRYYRKETMRVPYSIEFPKSVDPAISLKLPPSCPRPDGTYYNAATKDVPLSRLERQIESEESSITKNVRDYVSGVKELTEMGLSPSMSAGRKKMIQWFQAINTQIGHEQKQINSKSKHHEEIEPHQRHLVSLATEKLAVITMHQVLSGVMRNAIGGVKYTSICMEVGVAVETEIRYEAIKKGLARYKSRYIEKKAVNTNQRRKAMKWYLSASEKEGPEEWQKETHLKVGSFLVALLIEHALIKDPCADGLMSMDGFETEAEGEDNGKNDMAGEPAFIHSITAFEKKARHGVITAHPEVINSLSPEECENIVNPYNAKLMPMCVAPNEWGASSNGPYLKAKTKIMRTYSKNQENTLQTADLSEVCSLLTILGKLSWRINTRVYDVVKEGWERGGNLPYVPSRNPLLTPTPAADFRENPESRLIWRKERNKTARKNSQSFSLQCDFLLKLKAAEALLAEDAFFFPHNMDFRGRCYPIPPHLNHIGSDVCRGLLQFAEGKPLGEKGLYWLKAHIAALCGVNKVSFDDRVSYTEKHIADIIDSAENPLDGNRWWLEADDAWQCLGCCFELRDALRMKDPSTFVSHMPIHMDGSCNGLQHYAALGGDIDGGRSVNLMPADCPQDVYTHVLQIVQQRIAEDAANGDAMAQSVVGKIIRKTIKQTVMTSVYGVTYIGARLQIAGQLRDQEAVADEDLFKTSVYVTKVTFDAMQSMFGCARQIMSWLGDTARTVCRTGATMQWKTPIGIPVEQHYRRPGKMQVKTLLQTVLLTEHSDELPVLVQKQRSAFPPNYVHSLDSTHMFKTAKACDEEGIAFAAVHDSYWTHACTVDPMNQNLRSAFVELHKRPLLQELVDHIKDSHPNIVLTPYPERGPLDINLVKESNYFFH